MKTYKVCRKVGGTMNDYNLSCGCVQTKTIGADRVELYKEHATYHVRRHSEFIDGVRRVNDAWLCFDSFKDAQKAFKRQCAIAKTIHGKR